jgi:hypothetical protein
MEQYGVCWSAGVRLSARNCRTEIALCTDALSRCKNQPQLHKYYLFLFFETFLLILLQLECRIVDSPSSLVVHFQL